MAVGLFISIKEEAKSKNGCHAIHCGMLCKTKEKVTIEECSLFHLRQIQVLIYWIVGDNANL